MNQILSRNQCICDAAVFCFSNLNLTAQRDKGHFLPAAAAKPLKLAAVNATQQLISTTGTLAHGLFSSIGA